ncbi:TlpA family protein disulfide reductase [Aestuariibaculum sediminum]|uniref:TlpA family protein disulfide reductase n=1 Tax=Aestuariibaculum sediminum TaxID=2770637 RepID=A0A8J6UH88_9FLAO|nr:TlpA disulfide reductase family protein [Aestuariibaculum sediminum]MBD0832576.1 TlpA family protein disulfide reductase [Aestuariibaculum sediminum]
MNKFHFAILSLLFMACIKPVDKTNEYTVIKFNITGFEETNNDLYFSSSSADLSIEKPFRKIYKANNNEPIVDTLNLENGVYFVGDGNNFITLDIINGSNLSVSYNIQDFKSTLKITGEGSEQSNYRLQKDFKKSKVFYKKMYELNEHDFIDLQLKVKNDLINFIQNFTGVSEDFKSKEIRNLHYEYLANLSRFEASHAYYTKNKDFKVSEAFYKEFEGLKYDNVQDFIFSRAYQGLVFEHYKEVSLDYLISKPELDKDLALLLALNTISDDKIKYPLFYRVGVPVDTEFTDELTPLYHALVNAYSKRFKYLENEDVTIDPQLKKGMPSTKFVNFENLGGGTTSLEDLAGSYIYIDVWATWCAPCKDQIPFLKKAEELFHDKNIQFVSISVDQAKDYEKLKRTVSELNLKGIQLFANGEWKENDFMNAYHINSIPRFILIGPDGKIVDADAPRPSTRAFFDLLEQIKI